MTSTITRPQEKKKQKTEGQPPYNVVLLDDDEHSYEYVIHMLEVLFGHLPEKGYRLAVEVDTTGRVVVATTHLEHAELKRDQIQARSEVRRVGNECRSRWFPNYLKINSASFRNV